jgi:hypothetical protein
MFEGVCWVFGCEIPEPSNPLLEGEDVQTCESPRLQKRVRSFKIKYAAKICHYIEKLASGSR